MIAVESLQAEYDKTQFIKKTKFQNVIAKSDLNKAILNISLYQFIQMLEYKLKHNGKFFVGINTQCTSKTCNICGYVKENLTLKDREYYCEIVIIQYTEISMQRIIS